VNEAIVEAEGEGEDAAGDAGEAVQRDAGGLNEQRDEDEEEEPGQVGV
jgi:hypothetical protein